MSASLLWFSGTETLIIGATVESQSLLTVRRQADAISFQTALMDGQRKKTAGSQQGIDSG
ncbi:hypothetical protein YC2023_088661 [Brassica napus]